MSGPNVGAAIAAALAEAFAGEGASVIELSLGGEATVDARSTLAERFALWSEEHSFEPGDIIRRKPGIVDGSKPLVGGLAVFIAYGQPTGMLDFDVTAPSSRDMVDCRVGRILSDGSMVIHYDEAQLFEPAPDEPAPDTGESKEQEAA